MRRHHPLLPRAGRGRHLRSEAQRGLERLRQDRAHGHDCDMPSHRDRREKPYHRQQHRLRVAAAVARPPLGHRLQPHRGRVQLHRLPRARRRGDRRGIRPGAGRAQVVLRPYRRAQLCGMASRMARHRHHHDRPCEPLRQRHQGDRHPAPQEYHLHPPRDHPHREYRQSARGAREHQRDGVRPETRR